MHEVGRAGRDDLPARADTYYNSYDNPKALKKQVRSHEVLCPVQGM